MRNDALRQAIRANRVSFPNPVPTFERHDRPDLQWKLALLYFVRGWNATRIAARYGLIRQRVDQILKTWKRRAVEVGYIQHIPPDGSLATAVATQLDQTITLPAPHAPPELSPTHSL